MFDEYGLALFLAFAVPIAIYDIKEFRVPDLLSLGGILAFAVRRLLLPRPAAALWDLLLACCLGFSVFWAIRMITSGRLGLGDAKCSAFIAAAIGMRGWFLAMCLAAGMALLAAMVLMAFFRMDRKARIPFAPFLVLGGAVAILFSGLWPRFAPGSA